MGGCVTVRLVCGMGVAISDGISYYGWIIVFLNLMSTLKIKILMRFLVNKFFIELTLVENAQNEKVPRIVGNSCNHYMVILCGNKRI